MPAIIISFRRKRKRAFYVILLLASILMITHSCRKEDSATVYPINSYVKDYYDYKQGSYWIYKDALTGDVDSFAVVNYIFNTRSQEVNISINEYHNTVVGTLISNWTLNVVSEQAFLFYKIDASNEVDYLLCYPLFKEVPLAYSSICHDSVYTQAEFLTTYIVNGNTYDSVYNTYYAHHIDSCYQYNQNDRLYTVKNIGLIKMDLNNYVRRVWELQHYKVVQ